MYIQNRCPHSILKDKTPEEVFLGIKPEVVLWVGIPPTDLEFKGSNHACRKWPFQRLLLFPILPAQNLTFMQYKGVNEIQ